MIRLEIKTYGMILTENKKISAWSSGRIDKNKYLTVEEILKQTKETRFTYTLLSKALEK